MIKQRIMYVCSECAEGCPEACGHYDRTELRVMPDGAWLCESCFDNNDDNEFLSWGHLPAPEEYRRIPASAQSAVTLRWARPGIANTLDEMRANAWKSGLADIGDTVLIWVNEGDLWQLLSHGIDLKEFTSSDGQLGEAGRAGVVADMGARPMSPAGVAPGPSDVIEQCAKIAEEAYADPNWHMLYRMAGTAIAARIRDLSQHTEGDRS